MQQEIINELSKISLTLQKDWLDYTGLLLSICTLGFLYWNITQTKKIIKDNFNSNLDAHLPILICKEIYLDMTDSNFYYIQFVIYNEGFLYYNLETVLINDTDYSKNINKQRIHTEGREDIELENVKIDVENIKKIEIIYRDIHNRKITTLIENPKKTESNSLTVGKNISYHFETESKIDYEQK